MSKEELQQELRLKTRQWQRWCGALGFSASLESYSEEQINQLQKLRQLLNEKVNFDDAIATITGQPPPEENAFASALMKRAKSQLDALRPEEIGDALVEVFDQRVAIGFIKGAKRKKPTAFEQMVGSFSPLAIEGDDCLEVLILEAGDDEVA
jgi:hypothetical protein